jgi:hypothetical protein
MFVCAALLAASIHALPGDWNEIHPGFECQHNQVIGGAYLNSEGDLSGFVGMRFDVNDKVSFDVAAVTGYSAAPVVPMARVNYKFNDNFRVFAAPVANTDGDVGAVFGAEVRFKPFGGD